MHSLIELYQPLLINLNLKKSQRKELVFFATALN